MFEALKTQEHIELESFNDQWDRIRNYNIMVVFDALGMMKKVANGHRAPCSYESFKKNLDDEQIKNWTFPFAINNKKSEIQRAIVKQIVFLFVHHGPILSV